MRALIYLAERRGQGAVTLNQICDDLRIPRAFLSKILQQLCRGGILRSHKGPSGGFLLAGDPSEITVLKLVEEMEGPIRVFECFSEQGDCTHQPKACRILSVFDGVGTRIQEILRGVTLADLLLGVGSDSTMGGPAIVNRAVSAEQLVAVPTAPEASRSI